MKIDWKEVARDAAAHGLAGRARVAMAIAELEEVEEIVASLTRIEALVVRWVAATRGPEIEDVQILLLKCRAARIEAEKHLRAIARKP